MKFAPAVAFKATDEKPTVTRLERGQALMNELRAPELPKAALPPATDRRRKANDQLTAACLGYASTICQGAGFLGFAFLAELAQISEYRVISTRLAQEMTRKWIRFYATSENDKSKQIKELHAEDTRLQVRNKFCQAMTLGGFYGRAQMYPQIGDPTDNELRTPLIIDKIKVKQGSLKSITVIDPTWVYAYDYNAENPLKTDYYVPSSWYVMGKEVHATRLLPIIPYPVPDILKPIYAFSGISLSQLAMATVENFLKMRQSVSAIVLNYSLRGIQTNLEGLLSGGDDAMGTIATRASIIANLASNEGMLILDKEQEAFFQHTTPLTNLEKLLDQARDNMCAVANIPRMVLFGLSPEGMNATAAGELEVFEQYVAGMQETVFRPQLDKIVHMMMLSLWGEVDPEIAYEFAPLREMSAKDEAEVRNLNAQSDNIYASIYAVGSDEVRARLAHDPNSGYDNLDLNRKIVPADNTPNPTGSQPNTTVNGSAK
jgi:phage-related protein (TIGR01555 family)